MVLVTTRRYAETLEVGDPVAQAKVYQAQAVDELIFLDLDASLESRAPTVDVIRAAAREVFMPLTVGGGVRSLEDFRLLLRSGADKVAVNTAAVETPELIGAAASAFGSQCVVVSIDFRRAADGTCRVWSRGGTASTDLDPVDWARECERRGAGELLLTSIDRDGTRSGLDLDTTRRVADAVSVPVIASGGCGSAAHIVDGLRLGGADAVAAGTYFSLKDENPIQTRSQIANAGISIRLHR
jgi:cyclase